MQNQNVDGADLVVSLGIYEIPVNKRLLLFLLFVININNINIKQLQENVKAAHRWKRNDSICYV